MGPADFAHTLSNIAWRIDCGHVKERPNQRRWIGFRSTDERSLEFYRWINKELGVDGEISTVTSKNPKRRPQHWYKVTDADVAKKILDAVYRFCNRKKRIENALLFYNLQREGKRLNG